MNEFIRQFILESRDYIEQGFTGLAVLDRSPHDAETLDSVFRAFHTLKGGASIVEFRAMERAVHAAEEVLSRARSRSEPLTSDLAEGCLSCLDQVSRWLDAMELSGELPDAADAEAGRIIERIDRATYTHERSQPAAPTPAHWADTALKAAPHLRNRARTAIRFTPRSASFFEGVDPLAIMAGIPRLLWLDVQPRNEWPGLEEHDPFESILVITALSGATSELVTAHLAAHLAECELLSLPPHPEANDAGADLPANARKLIDAQLELLATAHSAGTIESAGLVVINVLRYCGQNALAERVGAGIQQSLRDRNSRALCESIAAALTSDEPPSGAVPKAEIDAHHDAAVARTLRVDAERVDTLVRLTGELTVVKNAIGHAVMLAQTDRAALTGTLKDHYGTLERLMGELQRAVLALRVLPLRTVLQRFPRLVRDMSANLRKSARLVVEGDETEADKAIVEALYEPLLHIVRNAMDHGVEEPAVRRQRGKPADATIRMRASRSGANVVIEITDDGAGIDMDRVRKVAEERGVGSRESLKAMPDSSLLDLVFAPGFSTAANVTRLSGRGVGMDAVRTAVERMGGRAVVESRSGEGTSVTLTLPFSVMMAHVMTVEAGGQMFGIPLDAVLETIRVPLDAMTSIGAARAVVHRDRTIPILELANVLHVREANDPQPEATIVIASVGGHLGGIQVDRLGERMEVMLKPLDGLLAGLPGLAGTTILGDGRVLLVLDLTGVLQ